MKYKLISIDLDGTLLNDKKEISKKDIDTLQKLSDLGIEIIVATGRSYWSAKQFIKNSMLEFVIMANNGNIVRNIRNDEVILSKYLPNEDFYSLLKEGRKMDLYPIIHADHYQEGYDLIIELDKNHLKYSNYLNNTIDRYKKIEDALNYNSGRILSVCYLSSVDVLEKFYTILINKYSGLYACHILKTLTKVGPMLEVMNPNGSKWNSIKEYALTKGIKRDEIISIGDDTNDLCMIKEAGLGIAMKNAHDDIKKYADIISGKTNNECGVSAVLTEIFGF